MKRFILITLIVLLLFSFGCVKKSQEESIRCNVGNIKTMSTPYGAAGGPITGIESHKLMSGETIKLCCSEAETDSKVKLKVCSRSDENNLIIYDLVWRYYSGKGYVKLREMIPQYDGICTYHYDENGEIESRDCR